MWMYCNVDFVMPRKVLLQQSFRLVYPQLFRGILRVLYAKNRVFSHHSTTLLWDAIKVIEIYQIYRKEVY